MNNEMTLEQAIKTAIEYETKVRNVYLDNVSNIADEAGRRVFEVLGNEEQGHIDYLNSRLVEWQNTGAVSLSSLDSVVPDCDIVEAGVKKLDDHISNRDYGTEREMLKKALALEEETSAFYSSLVDELGNDGKLFARFMEIEKGHLRLSWIT